jgi:hypothetical protein
MDRLTVLLAHPALALFSNENLHRITVRLEPLTVRVAVALTGCWGIANGAVLAFVFNIRPALHSGMQITSNILVFRSTNRVFNFFQGPIVNPVGAPGTLESKTTFDGALSPPRLKATTR